MLVDGNDPPALPCDCEADHQGDARVASIAAASIVAKVTRDRMMARLDAALSRPTASRAMSATRTPQHRAALDRARALPRAPHDSFAPVKGVWPAPTTTLGDDAFARAV